MYLLICIRLFVESELSNKNSGPLYISDLISDLSDVLIGWHIELDTNVELQKSITKAFMAFKPFWMSDISYPLSLIMQVKQNYQA